MCDTSKGPTGSTTAPRPSWWRLYARAGLMLAALISVQVFVRSGTELTLLECSVVIVGFVTMVRWARRNAPELDRLEWCDCASSRVAMRVIPSRRGQLVHIEDELAQVDEDEGDARAPVDVEPVTASSADVARYRRAFS